MTPKTSLGRLFLMPFKPSDNEWLNGLGFGIAGTYGNESGDTTSVYRTWGQSTWFSYNNGVTAGALAGVSTYRATTTSASWD